MELPDCERRMVVFRVYICIFVYLFGTPLSLIGLLYFYVKCVNRFVLAVCLKIIY